MSDTDMLTRAAHRIRSYLEPLWDRLHESDRRFGRVKNIPAVKSTAMCRHSAPFALRALDRAGLDGLMLHSGMVDADALPSKPTYMLGQYAVHLWLEDRDGHCVDLTGDQFGYDPVLVCDARPAGYPERLFDAGDLVRGVMGTIQNWEGDPRASWGGEMREVYEDLIDDLREIVAECENDNDDDLGPS